MTPDCVNVGGDPRVRHCEAVLNGRRYHYLLSEPADGFKNTILLIHGWPDLSMGWRYQIPALRDRGYRIVCPDCIGYGRTDAPRVPPASLAEYSFKRTADDLRQMASHLGCSRVILGGHDWGGIIVYRIALWCPELVSHVFSICTPYNPPSNIFHSTEDIVQHRFPFWGYQLQLASPEVEQRIQTREQVRQLLSAFYGGVDHKGRPALDFKNGLLVHRLADLKRPPVIDERTLNYYVDEYMRNGLHGTLNWYRTREQNYQDELALPRSTIDVPVLFIQAEKDKALPPVLSRGMEKVCPQMTRRSVPTHHWATWEAPDLVNQHIVDWLAQVDGINSKL